MSARLLLVAAMVSAVAIGPDVVRGGDPVFRAHILGGIRWALAIEN